jgi:hypothetical protein
MSLFQANKAAKLDGAPQYDMTVELTALVGFLIFSRLSHIILYVAQSITCDEVQD